jgi:hypothetical protein
MQNDLPFHLGGEPDGSEPLYRCRFDLEANQYVLDDHGMILCRWNSIGGFISIPPWHPEQVRLNPYTSYPRWRSKFQEVIG